MNFFTIAFLAIIAFVKVQCNDIKGVRLGENHTISSGPLLISNGVFWEPVCSINFNDNIASIICHQLGYRYHGDAISSYQLPKNEVGYTEFQCDGDEENLQKCSYGHGPCNENKWVHLTCDVGGVKVTCDRHSMTLTINVSSIPGFFKSRHFNLLDPNCFASPRLDVIELSTSYEDCGTILTVTNESFIYSNKAYGVVNLVHEFIIRNRNMTFPFECYFSRSVAIGEISFQQPQQHNLEKHAGHGHIEVIIQFFKSSNFSETSTDQVSDEVFSKNMIYFQISTNIPDPKIQLMTETCVATPSPNAKDEISFKFLENGCLLDETLKQYSSNKSWAENFSIESFRFDGFESNSVFFHCNVFLCDAASTNTRCSEKCIPSLSYNTEKSRRQVHRQVNKSQKQVRTSIGPVHFQDNKLQRRAV